jgi:hypothetical protein
MCDGFFKRVRVKSEFFEEFLWFLDLKRVVRFGDSYGNGLSEVDFMCIHAFIAFLSVWSNRYLNQTAMITTA